MSGGRARALHKGKWLSEVWAELKKDGKAWVGSVQAVA